MNLLQRLRSRLRHALFGTPEDELRCAVVDAELDGDTAAAGYYQEQLEKYRQEVR